MRQNDSEGVEWFQKCFAVVNELLLSNGLPAHEEPDAACEPTRASCCSFPYSFVHFLRYALAQRRRDPQFVAAPMPGDDLDEAADLVIHEVAGTMDVHLICHSDAGGFYVPIDFPCVIVDSDSDELTGGLLGSSNRLAAELIEVAPAIGVRLGPHGSLSEDELNRINSIDDTVPLPFSASRSSGSRCSRPRGSVSLRVPPSSSAEVVSMSRMTGTFRLSRSEARKHVEAYVSSRPEDFFLDD